MFEFLKKWNRERKLNKNTAPFPHCDQRVLHAPGQCEYCDLYPHMQELRVAWGICFTGSAGTETRDGKEWTSMLPCPSDYNRGVGGAHVWAGNRPHRKER